MKRATILIALTAGALAAIAAAGAMASPATKHTDQLTYADVGAIVLDDTQGHIHVFAGHSHSVKIDRTTQTLFGHATHSAYARNGVLHLSSRCHGTACQVDYRINAPAGVRLRITNRDADVSISGSPGDVAISDTDTGDLTFDLSKAPRHLAAATRNGSIDIAVPRGAYSVTTVTSGKAVVTGITVDRKATHSVHASASGNVTITGR